MSKKIKPRSPKNANLKDPDADIMGLFEAIASLSGVTVNAKTALGTATTFGCVNIVSRYLSKLPLKIYDKGTRLEADDHPLSYLLGSSPNSEHTSYEYRTIMQSNLSLRGNAYSIVEKTRRGTIGELIPVDTADVLVDKTTKGRSYRKKTVYIIDNREYSRGRILHLRGLGLSGACGIDPLSIGREIFGLAIALDDNACKFFGNSSRPGAVLEAPKGIPDSVYQNLKAAFDDQSSGENTYRTIILEHGLKFAMARMSNDQSQFDQTRERQAQEIARFFGVPGHKVGISGNIPRANVQEQNIEFITDTIGPIACMWEQALTKYLLTKEEREEYYIEFSLNAALRGNVRDRTEYYKAGRQWGWLSQNDVRKLENMPPIEGGDSYQVPMNMEDVANTANDEDTPENNA